MTQSTHIPTNFVARGHTVELEKCRIMGIVNITPDSFSDGGQYLNPEAGIRHALSLLDDGADMIDIGGMSTRPGAAEIAAEVEQDRVLPVIEGIRKQRPDVLLSIDTTHAGVAEAALERGVQIINSVRALEDEPRLGQLAAQSGAGLVLMHSSGTSDVMQDNTNYSKVPEAQITYLTEQSSLALTLGVKRESIVIDPGFGFGKTLEQNLTILRQLDDFSSLGFTLLVGLSRKSFLGQISGLTEADQRDGISHVAGAMAYLKGARILRVHDVAGTRHSLNLMEGLCSV